MGNRLIEIEIERKQETHQNQKNRKQEKQIHQKIGNPPKKEKEEKEKGGHRKSPKTDESRTENAPIKK